MRNKEIKSVVYETKDYNQFKKIRGNRDVNLSHVEKLKKSIAEKKLDIPILVNKSDYSVVDGQHRLEAHKQLGLPIKFILGSFDDPLDVARVNANQRSWNFDNYCDFHAKRGKQDYQICRHIADKYEINIEAAVVMLSDLTYIYRNVSDDFKVGDFKIKPGCIEKAHELGKKLLYTRQYVQKTKRVFIAAFIMLNRHPDFKWERFKTALKVNGLQLAGANTKDAYIQWFEKIYNHNLASNRTKFKKLKLVEWVKDKSYLERDNQINS